jgi:hypothetical protein
MNGYTNGSGAASHSQLLSRLDANQEAIESGNALLVNEQGPALVSQWVAGFFSCSAGVVLYHSSSLVFMACYLLLASRPVTNCKC